MSETSLKSLESWLKFWEFVSETGFIIVILGVIGEGTELLVKWTAKRRCRVRLRRGMRRFLVWIFKRVRPKLLLVETLSFGVLVGGLGMEFWGGHKAMRIADTLNATLKKEAGDAHNQAAQAIERAAKLESTNLMFALTIEELRSNNIAIEEQMRPRYIEMSRPAARLKTFAGTKAVIICAVGGDCATTANQIGAILQSANWDVKLIGTLKPVISGVSVGLCSSQNELHFHDLFAEWWGGLEGKSQLHLACVGLVNELNNGTIATKLDSTMYFQTSLRFDGIVVFVGPKPSRLDEQLFKLENEERNLDQQLDDVSRSEWALIDASTNRAGAFTVTPELTRLRALEQDLRNRRYATSDKYSDLVRKQTDQLFGRIPTNSGGSFSMGYEILP